LVFEIAILILWRFPESRVVAFFRLAELSARTAELSSAKRKLDRNDDDWSGHTMTVVDATHESAHAP
jgi:hypothetical protein